MRTLYNIYNTPVVAIAQKAMAAMGVLLLVSCADDKVQETIQVIDPISTDPIGFTCSSQQDEVQQTTRASVLLTSDFMVSTYKAFAQTKQQTVMENYHVEYKTTGTAWDGNQRPYWDYTQVPGQYERFWDYSNFPYRFHAIAPYPSAPSGSSIPSGYLLSDKSLKIPTPYHAQTCHNGMITPTNTVAEPHLVAQVQRTKEGKDYDLLSHNPETHEIFNNLGSTALNRYVALPFHHLNSKIRFGVYHTTQWLTANKTYIEHLTISVTSPSFVIQASGYQPSITPGNSGSGFPSSDWVAANSWYRGTGNSGFTNPQSVASATSSPYQIFRFDGGVEVADNDLTEHQTRQTAFWLQCKDGIMQIPQENVQMIVSFDLMKDGEIYQSFTNVPVRLEIPANNETDPPTYDYDFDWRSGYIYTYYLVIGEIDDKLEITFTATLTPWEDVTGSLSTDLEQ